jgi:hypothetical protein
MSENTETNFGFFNEEIDKIDVLKVETDIIYDFHLEADKLRLIMSKLSSLSPKFCILCQVKYITGKNASVRLLFTSLLPNYPDFLYTNLKKQYVNNTEYILSGTLKQNLLTLTPAFISRLKENRMIGVCFISVKLLLEKITTWVNQKRYLSDVLTTNVLGDGLIKYLSNKDLLNPRLVSKKTKENIDFIRSQVTFEQSKLPEDFDYTQDSFETLCAKYGREPKDCALHIIYSIDVDIDIRGRRTCVAKLLDEKGEIIGIDTTLFSILAQCDIKLSIKIIISPFAIAYYDRSISLLCSIVENLKNTIYSFEIDFGNYYLTKNNYDRVSKVLMKIPNLTILKLSNAHIQWKLFLLCIKSIQKLEELDLSEISMFTEIPLFNDTDSDFEDTYSDLERQEFDIKDFKKIWTESLKHLKGLRIAGNKSVISYNETVYVVQLDLMQTILPCLEKDFTHLISFGCTADPINDIHMESFIDYLSNVKNLTKLNLSGSNLATFDESEDVAKILGFLPNLRELDLSRCYLDMRFFEIILPAIQKLKMLRYLDLSNNEDFFPEDIRIIKKLFENLFLKIDK